MFAKSFTFILQNSLSSQFDTAFLNKKNEVNILLV
jgi:hypothetical protein